MNACQGHFRNGPGKAGLVRCDACGRIGADHQNEGDRCGDAEQWAEHERALRDQEWKARLPSSHNHRRKPRVRLRKGTLRPFIILGTRRTKRAAFRAARELRDAHGEKRPLVVWKDHQGAGWHYGTSPSAPSS